ncbi:MAG: helix-turn-helix transcriptional regulator [Acidimicrobiales bacterium]
MGPGDRTSSLPAGTLTFLLTDVQRSTHLWETAPEVAGEVLARQYELIGRVVAGHGGVRPEEQGEGDSVVALFASAVDAVAAALEAQRTLNSEDWPRDLQPRVRIGLHTGEARLRDDRHYTGAALHRCARLRDIAHGGQTLLSSVTASIVADAMPDGSWLRELGVHRLRDLSQPERVFELRHADLADTFPALRSLDVLANNLPVQLTSFVGRGDELAAVAHLLAGERLVTLTGSGGCGKTRLAVQAAAEQADRWPDGVWWVELGPVTDPVLVAELVASATGALGDPVEGPLPGLTRQLRDRRLLVCLDNCEHLVDACAEVAEALLRSCLEVAVLATSREPLGVAGETVWRVPSLVEDEALALFVERASRVRPWFTLDDTNEAAIRTMCQRLDGIPLAVELAAAWLRTLTPAQIAEGLDDRFALLVRGPRGAIARQQTLVASIDWSHDLLGEIDRVVFRRLAVFSGGFALDAARTVCVGGAVAEADLLDALGRLVDKSLVVAEERDGEARYRLLETIRQYAHDRLQAAGEVAAVGDRHLDHYLAFVETTEAEMMRSGHDIWMGRLEAEHDNLRAALDWGLSVPDPERGRRLAAAAAWLWWVHGHVHEGMDFLQRAIDRIPDDRSTLQARLLTGIALVADTGGPVRLELEAAQQALEIATANGDDRVRGRCLLLMAEAQFYVDFDAAWESCEQAERCAEAVGDAFIADGVLVLKGMLLSSRDRHDAARPLLEGGLERCLRRGERSFATMAQNYLDDAAVLRGDVRLADQLASRALQIAEPLDSYFTVGFSTSHLALAKGLAGDIEGGRRLMEKVVRSIEGVSHGGFIPRMARMAPVLGKLCLWGGDLDEAVKWFERDARSTDPAPDSLVVARVLPGLGAALRRLGRVDEARDTIDRAVALSRKLDVPHLLADGLEQLALLEAHDDPDRAEDLHHQALATRVEYGLHTFSVDSLDALAALAARAESWAEAARLLAASDAAREAMGYPRRQIDEPDHEATVATLRTALGGDAFADAWADGAALSLDEAIAYVRRSRGARGRPSTGWASLTPTEVEVVRLVVEGLSNPEIATRLLMSRGTVKTHLSHVYAKVSVANRTELATLAANHLAKD